MVHLLERLLATVGLPIMPALLLIGAVPVALGAWIRVQWRDRHDAYLRVRRAHLGLVRRFRRDPRTLRNLTLRLRHDTGWDPGRWLVATMLWLAVLLGWCACALALLRGAYVRDQLVRSLAHVPAVVGLLAYALWCAGLVAAARVGLDRASQATARPPARGRWPAVSRAIVPLFCSIGATTLLVDVDGYPLAAALLATIVPGIGLLVFGIVHDRLQPVRPFRLPDWLVRLEPDVAPPGLAAVPEPRALAATGWAPLRGPATGPVPLRDRLRERAAQAVRIRARAGAVAASAARDWSARVAQARPSMLRVVRPADLVPRSEPGASAARSWSDLAPAPTRLGPRDPERLGPYTLTGRIGAGGMATVFLGVHRSGQQAALKVPVHAGVVDDPTQGRLAAEIATMAPLDIPGVVRIREAGTDEAVLWVAMDYLRGPTLHQAVAALGPLSDPEALRSFARRVARALAGLHRVGVTHRDVKPGNLILTDAGPVLVDLGIARVADATHGLTATGTVIGSVGYLPPEAHRNQPYRHTADVWAWACCVGYAASGRALFAGETMHEVLYAVVNNQPDRSVLAAVRMIDLPLAETVERCIAPDPRRRPADGAELLALLPVAGAWIAPDRVGAPTPQPATGRFERGSDATTSAYDVSTASRTT